MSATPALPRLTLVLGGARSGKSRFAERLVESQPDACVDGACVDGACVYLATAEARDAEMAARIAEHRARRGNRWRTVEAPLDLVAGLRDNAAPDRAVLVDCLTLWLANLIDAGRDVDAETAALTDALPGLSGPVVMVSNEVGLGIVPDNALARAFRDAAGRLNQTLAAAAQSVVFMAAGLPLHLKSPEART
jgi:adenosylcobinamide kinase/adenosylcobinamide-phosphate guanylyltransferase